MNTMTTEQKKILLSARKSGLMCLENCLRESHKFPLSQAHTWWAEARSTAAQIRIIEEELAAQS